MRAVRRGAFRTFCRGTLYGAHFRARSGAFLLLFLLLIGAGQAEIARPRDDGIERLRAGQHTAQRFALALDRYLVQPVLQHQGFVLDFLPQILHQLLPLPPLRGEAAAAAFFQIFIAKIQHHAVILQHALLDRLQILEGDGFIHIIVHFFQHGHDPLVCRRSATRLGLPIRPDLAQKLVLGSTAGAAQVLAVPRNGFISLAALPQINTVLIILHLSAADERTCIERHPVPFFPAPVCADFQLFFLFPNSIIHDGTGFGNSKPGLPSIF